MVLCVGFIAKCKGSGRWWLLLERKTSIPGCDDLQAVQRVRLLAQKTLLRCGCQLGTRVLDCQSQTMHHGSVGCLITGPLAVRKRFSAASPVEH